MKLIKKLVSIAFIVIVAICVYNLYTEYSVDSFLLTSGTDEQKIKDTLEKFEQSYNDGDFDSLVKCCTGRLRSDLKSQMGLGGSVLSGLLSHFSSGMLNVGDSALGYLWSMGTAYCQMELEVLEITYLSDDSAEIELWYIEYPDSDKPKKTKAYIEMQKESKCWMVGTDFYQYSKA